MRFLPILLSLAFAVFLTALLPNTAAAQFCTATCFDMVDPDTGETYGHGCTNQEGGGLRCEATANGCAITECSDGPILALSEEGMPIGLVSQCGESETFVRADFTRRSAPSRTWVVTTSDR